MGDSRSHCTETTKLPRPPTESGSWLVQLFTIVALLVLTAIADELDEIVLLRFRGVERNIERGFARFVMWMQQPGSTSKRSADWIQVGHLR